MFETLKIISLSVLYGVTSLLPVSSLGHFSLLTEVFGFSQENFNSSFYYSLFSAGAGLAMYIYYFGIHKKILKNLFRKKATLTSQADKAYKTAGRNILISLLTLLILFIPTGKMRFVFSLGEYFLSKGSLIFVGIASIFCAVLMFISIWYLNRDYASKTNLLSVKNVIFFGLYQLPAYIFPGLSHISVGASRTAVSDIDIKNVLKETYLYLAPAFLITGAVKGFYYYDSSKGINIIAAVAGFVLSFALSLLMLSFINKYFSKKAYRAFAIYTLVFGLLITGTSLFGMLA